MKLAALLCIVSLSVAARASSPDVPPINAESIIGTWEATPIQNPAVLWHMEITKNGHSYLVQTVVGSSNFVVFRLASSTIEAGHVKLRFLKVSAGDHMPEILIEATGVAAGDFGVMELSGHVLFIKTPWTRAVAEASRRSEDLIKAQERIEQK